MWYVRIVILCMFSLIVILLLAGKEYQRDVLIILFLITNRETVGINSGSFERSATKDGRTSLYLHKVYSYMSVLDTEDFYV